MNMNSAFRLMIGYKFNIAFLLSMLFLTSAVEAAMVDGVDTGSVSLSATQNSANFDPPCLFAATLPLMGAPYMNPDTQSLVIDGEGTVLNECGAFGVTGYSKPNFLAWNCSARNIDGTRPILPLEIKFSKPISSVSIKVASGSNAGSPVVLRVLNAAHAQIGSVSAVLTTATQTLSIARTDIRYMRLEGPCVMIADDLVIK